MRPIFSFLDHMGHLIAGKRMLFLYPESSTENIDFNDYFEGLTKKEKLNRWGKESDEASDRTQINKDYPSADLIATVNEKRNALVRALLCAPYSPECMSVSNNVGSSQYFTYYIGY